MYEKDRRYEGISNSEYLVLKSLHDESRVIKDEQERKIIFNLEGLVSTGIDEDENSQLVNTASLTDLGNRTYHRERIIRSPIRRFFYKLASLFF